MRRGVAFNAPATPAAIDDIAWAIGTSNVTAWIFAFAERIGVPMSLRERRLLYSDLYPVAEEIAAKITVNPRPVTADDIRALLHDGWQGVVHPILVRRAC